QQLKRYIVFREQRVLIFHPARESEARTTSRATEDDPNAPAGLFRLSLGLSQQCSGVARGRSMLLDKGVGELNAGANLTNGHPLRAEPATICVNCNEYDFGFLGTLPAELRDGCRVRLDLFRANYEGQIAQNLAMFLKVQ